MTIEGSKFNMQARTLEDAFFIEKDRKLIEKYREMKKLEESRHNLSEASGITNDAVLDKLISLRIRAETLASMAMVPLVEVAWADGEVDEKEKKAILSATDGVGFKKDSIDYTLLEQWLNHRPGAELLSAWMAYVGGLCRQLEPLEKENLKNEIMNHARMVAQASGGFLGMTTKVSKAEKEMLDRLEAAFG